jgi:hypothetical protein
MNQPAGKWKDAKLAFLSTTIADHLSDTKHKGTLDNIQILLAEMDHERNSSFYQPSAFSSTKKNSDPDTPDIRTALSGDHAAEYWQGMSDEVESLSKRNTWTVIPRADIKPGHRVVPGTWAFKCKRRPDGSFRKFKARYTVRGDIQKRQSQVTVDTYSPVVQWASVRLMLVLTVIFGLATRQIDFSNAFAQTDIPTDEHVYVELPHHFRATEGVESVLKLNKALYGQLDAPKRWYDKLRAGLEARGLVASKVDPCLFISKHLICMIYVDDVCVVGTSQAKIDALLQSFKDDGDQYNWEMTEEGSISDFLGIDIRRVSQRVWKMTQEGLIDSVLVATGMTTCNAKDTPTFTDGKPLGSDKTGPAACEKWSYRSVTGMLLYLASNSRPDISFAVHQCARFTHNPRQSHEQALLRICRYLKGTKTQGLILKPTDTLSVDCYADADFAGLYGTEDVHDPVSVKSRTGYVITLAGCPLLWVSKLQSEICVSTLESEFVSLSSSMRSLIPMKRLISEVLSGMTLSPHQALRVSTKSQVFEDNAGALQLATTKKMTSRTRHMAVKYFWFLDKVGPTGTEDIDIVKVDTKVNIADIFTKNLGRVDFESLRLLLCG